MFAYVFPSLDPSCGLRRVIDAVRVPSSVTRPRSSARASLSRPSSSSPASARARASRSSFECREFQNFKINSSSSIARAFGRVASSSRRRVASRRTAACTRGSPRTAARRRNRSSRARRRRVPRARRVVARRPRIVRNRGRDLKRRFASSGGDVSARARGRRRRAK